MRKEAESTSSAAIPYPRMPAVWELLLYVAFSVCTLLPTARVRNFKSGYRLR